MFIICDTKNDASYKKLIDLAFDVCDEFILVDRNSTSLYLEDCGMLVLEKLKGSLKEMKKESEWVSNRLFDQTASVYYYRTDNEAREIIKGASNSLYSWVHPNLPEDLSFIKNGTPWLINNSHEHESYIETDDKEEIRKLLKIDGLYIHGAAPK